MISVEKAILLIKKHTDEGLYGGKREINKNQMVDLADDFVKEIAEADKEWEELAQLKIENVRLKAEIEVYRNFLLSSNYKLPKETKKAGDK